MIHQDRFSPWRIAESKTEHAEQSALFSWSSRARYIGVAKCETLDDWTSESNQKAFAFAVANKNEMLPELRWLHAVPNGGERGRAAAGQMKAEGVKRGIADVFWPYRVALYPGLYIELKRRNGVPSDLRKEQKEFAAFVTGQGYAWRVAYGWEQARETVISYGRGLKI